MALTRDQRVVAERSSVKFTMTLKDEDGVAVPVANIDAILFTLYDVATIDQADPSSAIIAGKYKHSVKDDTDDFTVGPGDGLVVWTSRPGDHPIVGSPAAGDVEHHIAHIEWIYNAANNGTLSNPFDTTNASTTVTVNHTAHGLKTNQTVLFLNAAEVGGITIKGTYTITKVDANSYTIEHNVAATSTVSGGGGASVSYWSDLKVGRGDESFYVKQFSKVP